MNLLLALILVAHNAPDDVPAFQVQRAERNHFYDDEGRQIFVQWIVWRWEPVSCRYVVDGWRLEKGTNAKFGDVAVFPGFLLRADEWTETHTQYDPELYDRERWPIDRRAGLPADWIR